MANNRGIKGGQRVMTANDPSTPAPLFNFYPYTVGEKYYNNQQRVDFVTYDGNLYVCTSFDGVTATESNPERNEGFLLIVKKGEDGQQGIMGRPGIDGSTPEIRVKFEGKRLVIYDATTQTRLTSSPELVGPTWKPVQQDNKITWRLDDGTSTPAAIDLDELRPKEEHPILLRLDSDNTKRSDEEGGPGYYIQWKREGNQEWTDLMSISELMNIALAGVTFWMADDEHGATDSNGQPIQRLHVGHKQVVRATYDASKLGNRRIADVELGEILFDGGEIPFPDFTEDINALNTFLCDLQGDLEVLRELIPLDYVKTVNGHLPINGDVQLTEYYDKETSDGRYLRSVKQLNGQSLAGTGGLWIKTVNNQPLLTNDQNGGNVKVVGSIQIGNGAAIEPDIDGIAHLPAYSGSDSTGGLTRAEADGLYQPKGNYLKGVRVNGTTYDNPNSSGVVDLGSIGGGTSPVDTSDCIKAIRINGDRQTPVNGEVSFTISVGGTSLFDVRLHEGRYLQKTTDGENWLTLLDINTIGGDPSTPSTGGLTEAQVKTLIGKILEGITEYIPSEYERTPGHNYFIRINDLSTSLSNYYTKSEIDGLIQNLTGVTPDTYAQWRPFSVYMRTQNDTTPQKPGVNDWKWYPNVDNKLHGASGSDVNVVNNWINDVPAATSSTPYLWVSWNSFSNLNGTTGGAEWSTPAQMNGGNGSDGSDGEDGSGIKFIFKLAANSSSAVAAPVGTAPEFDNTWSDNAIGIDLDHKVEYYCYSTFNGETWSAWQGPFIWSLWGENGVDGSGVEYIYLHQGSTNIAANNDPSKLATSVLNSTDYQSPDYVPQIGDALTSGTLGVDWTDEPSGVNSDYPYEFVSVRKYDGTTKRWGPFSEPKVWAHFGANGVGLVENNLIVPTSTTVSKVEVTSGNQTSYKVAGTVTWNLYHNDEQVTNGYCEAYLGSYTTGTILEVTNPNSSGNYSATVNQIWNNVAFLQIVWYEGNNNQGKLLDSVLVPVIIPGANGADGPVQSLDGPIMRIRQYDSNTQYHTENDPVDGIYYLDVVYYESNNKGNYYKCISSCKGVAPASNSQYWTPYSFLGDAAFESLLAKYAYIQDLTAKQVVITDNNTIVAGMTSGTVVGTDLENEVTPGDIRIWAGAITNGDLATAPFTVDNTGKLISDHAEITGEIHAESGSIDGTLTIGSNGKIYSTLTEGNSVHTTTLDTNGLSNSLRTGGYGNEVQVSGGNITLKEGTLSSHINEAILWPNVLGFTTTTNNGNVVTHSQAVTTVTRVGNVDKSPITSIECVTALPQDPYTTTLYIVI